MRPGPSAGAADVARVTGDGTATPTPPTNTGLPTPSGPSTRSSDRTRLEGAGGASLGSGVVGLRRGVTAEVLAPYRPKVKKAVEALALSVPSPHLKTALEALASHPQAEAIVVAALTGGRLSKTDEAAIASFSGLKVPSQKAADALLASHRREATTAALSGHHGDLVEALRPALLHEPDLDRLHRALSVVRELAETSAGSFRLASMLTAAGCFDPGDWRKQAIKGGTDAVGALAGADLSDPLAYDNPKAASAAEAAMAAAGVFDSAKWTRTHDTATHRGILGEALRVADVESSLTSPAQSVVQGILVITSPDALWNAPDAEAARAYMLSHGFDPSRVHHHQDEHGKSHWGRLLTEIDVAVMTELPDGRLRPLRFENVKAGVGSSGKANEQNTIAKEGWSDPSFRYLFPYDGGASYRSPPLDRSPAAEAGIAALTVGPADDPRYDAALPLTTYDITALALNRA